jgi:hypothetical protein
MPLKIRLVPISRLQLDEDGLATGSARQKPLALPGVPEKVFIPGLVVALERGSWVTVIAGRDSVLAGKAAVHTHAARNILVPVLILPKADTDTATAWAQWEMALSRLDTSRRIQFLAHYLRSNETSPRTRQLQEIFDLSPRSVGRARAQAQAQQPRKGRTRAPRHSA